MNTKEYGCISKISEKTGLSYKIIDSLLDEGLDKESYEYISDYDEVGVYIMDVANACGDYTMLPIPYDIFVCNLLDRIKQKTNDGYRKSKTEENELYQVGENVYTNDLSIGTVKKVEEKITVLLDDGRECQYEHFELSKCVKLREDTKKRLIERYGYRFNS